MVGCEGGGITHLPQTLCSLVVLGFAADLMRVEGFVAVNFSIHPKEKEKVLHRGGKAQKLGCYSQLLFLLKSNDS